jgi:hypothetical protein
MNIENITLVKRVTIGTANLHIAEEVSDETDVNTLLYTHVYDMDVGIMRALILCIFS